MTCCIVAALIISQILAFRDRIKRLLGFKVDDEAGLEPLLPPHIERRLRRAVIPALVLSTSAGLGYQHRDHLAALLTPSAHAAAPAIAGAICRGPATPKN
ncbi:MAG: hypothetical protein V4724_07905 [Pseudomonadota bacterium]